MTEKDSEDQNPSPPPAAEQEVRPEQSKEMDEWRQGGRELETQGDLSDWTPTQIGASGSMDAPLSVLTSIMQATLFADLFCRWAVRRCQGETLAEAVATMASLHPFYYKVCRWADFILRVVIVVGVLVVVFGAAIGVVLQTWYPGVLDGWQAPGSE